MTEREAFIRRICEEPDEDTHRLVFADWLDEHGEPERAEFIRVQMELARLGDPLKTPIPGDRRGYMAHRVDASPCMWPPDMTGMPCPWCSRRRREEDLFVQDGRNWFPTRLQDYSLDWFQRGFVEHVTCTHDDFLRHAEAVFRAHPVTSVTLTDREPRQTDDGWYWIGSDHRVTLDEYRHMISMQICVLLPDWPGFRQHPSRETALATLSAACVSLGRKRAGLPTLPQHLIGPHKSAQV